MMKKNNLKVSNKYMNKKKAKDKKEHLLAQERQYRKSDEYKFGRVIGVLPIGIGTSSREIIEKITKTQTSGPLKYYSNKYKTEALYLPAENDSLSIINCIKVSDILIFLLSNNIEEHEGAEAPLNSLMKSIGLPKIIPVVQNSENLDKKEQKLVKEYWESYMKEEYGEKIRKIYIDNEVMINEIERIIHTDLLKEIQNWKKNRGFMIIDKIDYGDNFNNDKLIIEGIWRGKDLGDSKEIYLTGFETDYRIENVNIFKKVGNNIITENIYISDSIIAKDIDHIEELSLDDNESSLIEQSDEYTNDDSLNDSENNDNFTDQLPLDDNSQIDKSENFINENSLNVSENDDYNSQIDKSEDLTNENLLNDSEDDDGNFIEELPLDDNEIINGIEKNGQKIKLIAKKFNISYFSLREYQKPISKSKFFSKFFTEEQLNYENFKKIPNIYKKNIIRANWKRKLEYLASKLTYMSGKYVSITLKNINPLNQEIKIEPIIIGVAIYANEKKLTIFNSTLMIKFEPSDNQIEINEKFYIIVDFRTYQKKVIIFEKSKGKNGIPILLNSIPSSSKIGLLMIGYFQYGRPKINLFKMNNSNPKDIKLIGLGQNIEDGFSHVYMKIALVGKIHKIHKSKITVHQMFTNPKDIKKYISSKIYSSSGKIGRIIEPLGLHGKMKCEFNKCPGSNEKVFLYLYKPIHPYIED